MSRTIEYQIVSAIDPFNLSVMVVAQIKDGWEPIGGIAFSCPPDGMALCVSQAMVRTPPSFGPTPARVPVPPPQK